MIDSKGRCCGRKPIVYRTSTYTSNGPQRFCPRCDRSYEIDTDNQIENFHWKLVGLNFVKRSDVCKK